MPRWLVMLALLLAVLSAPGPGAVHTMDVKAVLSFAGGRLSVQLLDPYGAAVAGGQVSAVVRPEGSRRSVRVTLQEEAPGTYVGGLDLAGRTMALQVNAQLGADLYRLELEGMPAEGDWSASAWPMAIVEPRRFPWGTVVYGMALAVLGAAATVALVRRSAAGGQEGQDR